jgi:DNA polymerase IV
LLRGAQPLIDDQGLTLVGVAVANLDNENAVQLTLPFDNHTEALDAALDELHERFGSKAITRATLLGKNTGMQVPLLPD